eukprot:snap_masked-scaffold_6-processed-gene-13.44-mRNA-1 protein AED:1.00 eAED:1.00 QI:0/0/0/0/1/1/3/0/59
MNLSVKRDFTVKNKKIAYKKFNTCKAGRKDTAPHFLVTKEAKYVMLKAVEIVPTTPSTF